MNQFTLKLSYSSHGHISELDGIRGLAIVMVMFYHCFPGYLTGLGWVGVDLFFVLSGFLITGILLDSKSKNKYYFNFIGRRILRIFPIYYLVLFIIFILVPIVLKYKIPHHFSFYMQHQGWFWSYCQNWLYTLEGFPENHLLVHFWSLAVEEQFYLIWPLIIFAIPNRHILKISILLCIVAFTFRLLPLSWFNFKPVYRYMATISRMDALLIGGIIAQLIRNDLKLLEKIALPVGTIGLIIFILGVMVARSDSFMQLPGFYTAVDLFMGLVLLTSFSQIKRIRRILRNPILTFLGKYSYGLYVYHYIIYILMIYTIRHSSIFHFSSYLQRVLIIGPITIGLTIIASLLSYHLFEVHFLKMKVYFQNKPDNKDTSERKIRSAKYQNE